MPKLAGPPLRKVTLNLIASDVDFLQSQIGFGYSEAIRDIVHSRVTEIRRAKANLEPYLLEDFDEE